MNNYLIIYYTHIIMYKKDNCIGYKELLTYIFLLDLSFANCCKVSLKSINHNR